MPVLSRAASELARLRGVWPSNAAGGRAGAGPRPSTREGQMQMREAVDWGLISRSAGVASEVPAPATPPDRRRQSV